MSLMTWSLCFAALYKRFKLQQYAAPTVLLLAANNFTPIHAFYCARNSATNFILLICYKCVAGINYVYGQGHQSCKLQK